MEFLNLSFNSTLSMVLIKREKQTQSHLFTRRAIDTDRHIGVKASTTKISDQHNPSERFLRINIDATRIGNIATFINHSCNDGNLSTILFRSSGYFFPRQCFFATRDIIAKEELCFSYRDVCMTGKNRDSKLNCCCGSSYRLGTLPCENT
uniref:Histone-lysine N-methyltransferase SUVR3 n=1 Tax=Noccaea caerulescens TaxID=107243 RepID=A0A1J3HU58_NOCCA